MPEYKCVYCKEVNVGISNCVCQFCAIAGVPDPRQPTFSSDMRATFKAEMLARHAAMASPKTKKVCVGCGSSFETTNNSPRCRACHVLRQEHDLPYDNAHILPIPMVDMEAIREKYPVISARDELAGKTVCGVCNTSWPDREKHEECPNCESDYSEFYLG